MALTKRRDTALATRTFEYQPAPEATDHVRIADRSGLFIGGKFVEPKSGKRFPTINPATEETLAEVAEALEADVNRAVEAAAKAQETWARLNPARRARYILRISRIIQERARELAVVETMNGGQPIQESRDVDIPLAAAHFFYYGGWGGKPGGGLPHPSPRPIRALGPG